MAGTPAYPERSPFPRINHYAFLSDCETNALLSPGGSVEWLCLPRPDGPSVFGALLDRRAGGFRLGAADVTVPAGWRYLPGTNVVETTWNTRSGWIIVRDALTLRRWKEGEARDPVWKRPPADRRAEQVLLRTVRCVDGHVELDVHCEPVFGYGLRPARWDYSGQGYGEAVATGQEDDPPLRLTTDLRLGLEGGVARARKTLYEGEDAFAALSWGGGTPPGSFDEARQRMWLTAELWREWLNDGEFPDHPWRLHLQRSALTLKGLSYAPTGALLAAATTSLPETPGGRRNWDYRYTWIRDATFALWGLYTLGFDSEADDFFSFVADVWEAEQQRLQVMYGIGGESELPESTLDHLSGYEGARPVRIGNDAYRQQQLDVWGAVLDSVYLHSKSRGQIPERVWPVLRRSVEAAIEHWREPDHGIWEVRGEPKHFTSSKLMCWVACHRGARLAEMRGEDDLVERWGAAAREIREEICDRAVDDRGVFVQHYDTTALDASILLMPLVRFLPWDDPRIRASVLAIADELTEDGLVLRYRVEETDDGLGTPEGAFLICSFWLVSALTEIGEADRARELCERLLSDASPLYLYAEELDHRTGRHLGNFPQAFTHLALINAVMHVIRADAREDTRSFVIPRLVPG
jgi:alpha,alpha-trehalase